MSLKENSLIGEAGGSLLVTQTYQIVWTSSLS